MKYTLTYRNKQGVEARIDIITFGSTSTTETIEGTDTPFILNYKREKNDKEGYIISSSADIAIYESGTFNIDTLKTSNETDIKVEYYIDNVLTWSGFVVPDFFSRVIGTPAIVNMVASDRLGSLKGQTLSGLPVMVTLSSLVSSCLSKTGLSLPINLKADFTSVVGNENVFASKVISQRFTDTKGRNISCYDILRSILVMTNSVVVQRNGQWYVANKIQIEQGTALPTTQYVDFDEVSVGARRQIMPVASSVGVYHEFGGERKHPQNFDFSEALNGWTAVNGFIAQVNNKEIIGFNYSDTEITPIFGSNDTLPYLLSVNTNPANKLVYTNPETGWNFEAAPYLKATFPVVSLNDNIVNINFDVGVIGIFSSYYPFVIIARNRNDANDIYALNSSGLFTPYDFHSDDFLLSSYLGGENYTTAVPGARKISGKLEVDNVTNYDIEIRIYHASIIKPRGYFGDVTLAINFASVTFNNETEIPKGNIYKTTQGDNFTKVHETDTTVIGDYRKSGLNGYGYPYPIDDTSSLLTSTGLLTERWTAPDNANELPILQHVTRQRAKMFSIAHDLLTAEIDSDVLDPLATFRDCSGKKYVMVSGSQDFLRGTINVEIEEIAYSTTIWKQDYIYSYFGEGEEGISSVGGISESAPSAGGGGITPEQLEILNNLSSWWKYDEANDAIYSDLSVYSKKEVSAYGLGDSGGGTGATALSELVDVDLASLEVGNMLVYNGTHWENKPQSILMPDLSQLENHLSNLNNPHQVQFSQLLNKPTTLAGYGITDAYTKTEVNSALALKLDKSVFDDLFEKVEISTGVYAIKAKYNFYSIGEVSAFGAGSGSGGGSSYNRLDAWADYDSSKSGWVLSALLGNDLNTRLLSVEQGSTMNVTVTGSGNAITSISKSGATITAEKGSIFSLDGHTHTFASITSKPTTLSGYGITDAAALNHNHAGVYEPAFTKNTAFNKNFGTSAGTVSEGNHTHTFASITSKPTTLSGYGITDAYTKTEVNSALALKLDKSVFDDLFEKVEISTGVYAIKAKYNFYSIGEVSAFGAGSGSGGGSSYNRLDAWADYSADKAGWVLSALLGNDLNTRLSLIEAGGSGSYQPLDADLTSIAGLTGTSGFLKKIGVNSWELDTNSYALASHTHTFASLTSKPTTLAGYGITDAANISHNHAGVYEPVFTKNTAFNKNFGTSAGTVSEGNHTHTFASLTSKPTTLAGYGITDAAALNHTHTFSSLTSKPTTLAGYGITDAYTKTEVNSALALKLDKSVFDDLFEKVEISTGVYAIKAKYDFYSVGEISAYGAGSGSGGGSSYNRLDAWADYSADKSGWVLSALLGNDLNTRLSNVESGSATSIVTTGNGNAITSLTKSGSVITANKELTFALASHTHTIAQITGLQGALDSKATPADISTAVNNLQIGSVNILLNSKRTLSGSAYNIGYFTANRDFVVGETITVTIKGNIPGTKLFGIWFNSGSLGTGSIPKVKDGYYSKQIVVPTGTNTRIVGLYLVNNQSGTDSWNFEWIRFDAGNKGSMEWSPAPEDQISDWNTTDVASFSYIKNKPTLLSQFTDNIGVASHIANKANPHAVTTAQIGAVDLTTNQSIGGNKSFTGNVTAPTFIGALSGNASSATKLQTARTIAGVSFDGSANIAIPFANLASKPTTLSGYGITDAAVSFGNRINTATTTADFIALLTSWGMFNYGHSFCKFSWSYAGNADLTDTGFGTIETAGAVCETWQNGDGTKMVRLICPNTGAGAYQELIYNDQGSGYNPGWRKVWNSGNLTNLNQLTTRNFSDLQNKPTTLSGYGITDAVTLNTAQTITGAKTFSAALTASVSVTTPKVIFAAAGWSLEQSGTELQMKYNGVVKQRMLSDGSIVATGELTAYVTAT